MGPFTPAFVQRGYSQKTIHANFIDLRISGSKPEALRGGILPLHFLNRASFAACVSFFAALFSNLELREARHTTCRSNAYPGARTQRRVPCCGMNPVDTHRRIQESRGRKPLPLNRCANQTRAEH
jgi:hypothetical protein